MDVISSNIMKIIIRLARPANNLIYRKSMSNPFVILFFFGRSRQVQKIFENGHRMPSNEVKKGREEEIYKVSYL